MLQLKKSAVISILIRLAAALPGIPFHIAAGLQARDLPAGVPACSTNDPSFSTATSQWASFDGQGYYAGSDCNSGGKGNQHCWTDYFLIGAVNYYDDWQQSDSIDCASTQNCAHAEASQQQSCTTFGWSATATISTSIEGGIGDTLKLTDIYTISGGLNGNVQNCQQTTNTDTCTWDDMQCHSIWQSPMKVQVLGYIRRSCNTARDGTNIPVDQQQAHRTDGYYTVGMEDFTFDLPTTSTILGCAAFCNQTTYPDPAPGPGPTQYPWQSS